MLLKFLLQLTILSDGIVVETTLQRLHKDTVNKNAKTDSKYRENFGD